MSPSRTAPAAFVLPSGLCICIVLAMAACRPVRPVAEVARAVRAPLSSSAPMDPQRAPRITLEDVATHPKPGTSKPGRIAFSPDDGFVTFLASPDHSLRTELYGFDLATGARRRLAEPPGEGDTEANLTLAEKLRRERQRSLQIGVTRYAWAKDADRFMVPVGGDVWTQAGIDGTLERAIDLGSRPVIDPVFARDGSQIAYVDDGELWVQPLDGDAARQLTAGNRAAGRTAGLAEFVAQEEMGRHHGLWWSRDGRHLAYVEVDESDIPIYRIVHQGKDQVGAGAQEDHRYPFAGAANARVRLGVVAAAGGATTWMDLGGDPDIYLARVAWLTDGRLVAQIQNRAQTRLELVAFDIATGRPHHLVTETATTWINLDDLFHPLEAASGSLAGAFVWGSERSGFRHLYLYDRAGQLIRPLTSGEWMVDDLIAVDETRAVAYFTANRDGVLERHLYAVSLDGGAPRRITTASGQHSVVIDHAYRRFVDVHESMARPPTVTVRDLTDGALVTTLFEPDDPRLERLALEPPELVTLTSRDGATLHGAVYRPSGRPPFPTVVSVYGGPHAQTVKDAWGMTSDMRAQYLRERGFLVFKLDNRGSAGRGVAFEAALHRDMGNIEVRDQVDGVQWLVAQGLADPARIAIYGWSYGGYMAAMALARAPETFAVAVAGAPVTHWDGYDTHYTERYMGTPENNPEGYAASSVMAHVDNQRGKLLLVHGLLDENVHFRHTARLIDRLSAARKDHQLILLANERHSPRRLEDRVYLEQRVFEFIASNL